MSDPHDPDLARLAEALQKATPAPNPERRLAAMAAARAAFANEGLSGLHIAGQENPTQGPQAPPRPIADRHSRRSQRGARVMFAKILSPFALATTGGLLAASVAVVMVLPQMVGGPGWSPSDPTPAIGAAPPEPAPKLRTREIVVPNRAPAATESEAADSAQIAITGSAEIGIARQGDAAQLNRLVPSPAPSLAFDADALAADVALPQTSTEAFAERPRSGVISVAQSPVSTFSVDVDTASWAVIRSSLMAGALPPEAAVRLEEMVNYFPYAYPAPADGDAPFRVNLAVVETPWNSETRLVRIGLQGELPVVEARPPLNLVLLIDTSGSMNAANKLPLLKSAIGLMLPQLRPEDQVAIVTYAGAAGVVLPPTSAAERDTIRDALDTLTPGGGTAGQAGLQTAYAQARAMASDGEVSRILLATDGDFNIGLSDPEDLETYIAKARDDGTYLSVLGFGRGNLDDATMQTLAQNGNGTAAYIDTLQEAQKVLVDQLSGALFPIADDVKVQIEFNPAAVAEYRLLGYETRALRREDFNNDRIDAGEIGAGHQVTALYEVTAPGSSALLHDPLRYQTPETPSAATELGFLRLRWKAPGSETSQLIDTAIPNEVGEMDTQTGFAAAIAGFGQLLIQSPYLGQWGFGDAVALAQSNRGEDGFGYRSEALKLMRLAESLGRDR